MVHISEKSAPLANRLSLIQQTQLDEPIASEHGDDWGMAHASTLERTRIFHKCVRLPVAEGLVLNPSVSLRLLRLSLILEEFEETVKAMGFELTDQDGVGTHDGLKLAVRHVEGTQYDPVETADGLADLDVVINGAMLSLGIPSREVGYEVYCSNMSKLDENGEPIVNQCQHYGGDRQPGIVVGYDFAKGDPINYQICHNRERDNECNDPTHRQRPDLPVGKVLKPDSYVKANVSAILVQIANVYGTTEN